MWKYFDNEGWGLLVRFCLSQRDGDGGHDFDQTWCTQPAENVLERRPLDD